MRTFSTLLALMSSKERKIFFCALIVFSFTALGSAIIEIEERSELVPVRGGMYREGIVGQPSMVNPVLSANPADQDISALVFSPLSQLLEGIEMKENGRVYLLQLKEGLAWSDGAPLTTTDLLFTIKLIQDPGARSPFAKSWEGVTIDRISELQARLTLPTSYVLLPRYLERLSLIPEHVFKDIPSANLPLSRYRLEPIGNGPYRVERITKRSDGFITQYSFASNSRYHRTLPFITRFSLKFYESEDELMKALRLREVDGFGSLTPIRQTLLPGMNQFIAEELSMPRSYAVFFNASANTRLAEREVRRALADALDKEQIVQEALAGEATVIEGPVLATLLETQNHILRETEEQTRRVLERDPPLEISLVVPRVAFLEKAATLMRDAWKAHGVRTVRLIVLSPEEVVERIIKTNTYELLLFGTVLENPEDLFPFWHSSQRFYPGLNLSLYENKEVDAILEGIRENPDPLNRKERLERFDEIIREDVPAIFLFSLPYIHVHAKRLYGFTSPVADDFVVSPADRFRNVNEWYVVRARALKGKTGDLTEVKKEE